MAFVDECDSQSLLEKSKQELDPTLWGAVVKLG